MTIWIPVHSQDIIGINVDNQVQRCIERGWLDSASRLLVSFANQEYDNGNLEGALDYQIKYCELIEQNIDSFIHYGITLKYYFDNYGMVVLLQRDLNRTTDAIRTYLELHRAVKKLLPQELPFYTNIIASTLGDCTDDSLADSIYCIQDALDVIKATAVTKDNVQKYIWFCRCFNMNRMYNSFNDSVFEYNRVGEIETWYKHNSPYIHSLDTIAFKKEIIEYEIGYANLIGSYAGALDFQQQNLYGALELYGEEVQFLESLSIKDVSIQQKIASCYAEMSSLYYRLGNSVLCKEYCDKTLLFLFNHNEDYDYCNILRALSHSYFVVGNYEAATNLKLKEMTIREKLGWHCTSSDWSMYFLYAGLVDPEIIIEDKDLALFILHVNGMSVNSNFYLQVGKAYSRLMEKNEHYKDSAELYFHKSDSAFYANKDYNGKYELTTEFKSNYYQAWAGHYSRLGQLQLSYDYYKEALSKPTETELMTFNHYFNVSCLASYLHKMEDIHKFLPLYYGMEEKELCEMMPVLGEVESGMYLGMGTHPLYQIFEWASWNPTDSVSISLSYDAALVMKGLLLRYNTISPYTESHSGLLKEKRLLEQLRDSIYSIVDDTTRLLALHNYELKEREILKGVNREIGNVHWIDIANHIGRNEVCIEFVKYTANAYSWCNGIPTPHYAALVLIPNGTAPQFVDLFDEDTLMDVYKLQPKSYDTESGRVLYSALWGKLHQYIEGKERVYFSPMGLLNLINIELLSDSTGLTALEKYNLCRVSSTKNVLVRTPNEKIKSIVAFGGIDYENATKVDTTMISLNTRGNWSYLKNTEYEVEQIRALATSNNIHVVVNSGADATETKFKLIDGTKANIVHIASHGYYIPPENRTTIPYFANSPSTQNVQDELFYSGTIMSGGQKAWTDSTFSVNKDDGILSAYEISKLDLHNVTLVVLSACETGLGDVNFDGIFGLQRAFKKAGVESVLMSLWKIDDKATSEFMGSFYEKLLSGSSVRDSYMNAIGVMKKKYQDANYWASFVLLE